LVKVLLHQLIKVLGPSKAEVQTGACAWVLVGRFISHGSDNNTRLKMDSKLERVCFRCGSRHKGEDVICGNCKRETSKLKQAKPTKTKRNWGEAVTAILNTIHVLISLIVM